MKKISFLLFSLLAATMFTSCLNGDDPEHEQTVLMIINSRAFGGDSVVFSQGSSKVTFNLVDMTMAFTCDYKDAESQSRTVTTPVMKLTATGTNSSVYKFEGVISQSASGIETIAGYIDMVTLMTWFSISDYDGSPVICTSQPNYIYATTNVSNPEDGKNYNHKQSTYLFAIDAKGGSCIFQIKNFIPNTSGLIQADVIQYEDIKVTPTSEGYIITTDKAESSLSGQYTITDMYIVLNSQCRFIDGIFTCEGLTFVVRGELFPTSNP